MGRWRTRAVNTSFGGLTGGDRGVSFGMANHLQWRRGGGGIRTNSRAGDETKVGVIGVTHDIGGIPVPSKRMTENSLLALTPMTTSLSRPTSGTLSAIELPGMFQRRGEPSSLFCLS